VVRKHTHGRRHLTQKSCLLQADSHSDNTHENVLISRQQGRTGQGGAGQGRAGRGRPGQARAGQGRTGQGFALKRSSIIWVQRRAVTGVLCSRLGLQFTSISHTFKAWSTTKSYPNSSWLLGRACRLSCTTNHPCKLCCIGCYQAPNNRDMHFVKA